MECSMRHILQHRSLFRHHLCRKTDMHQPCMGLLLLLCHYAVPVLQSAWGVVNSMNDPSYYRERFLFRNGDIIKAILFVCHFLVPVMLFRIKEYNTDKRYKVGLLLMMLRPIKHFALTLGTCTSQSTDAILWSSVIHWLLCCQPCTSYHIDAFITQEITILH